MSDITDFIESNNQNAVLVIHSPISDPIPEKQQDSSKNSKAVGCLPQAIPSVDFNQSIWKNRRDLTWKHHVYQWKQWISIPFQRNSAYWNEIETRYIQLLEKTNPMSIPNSIEDYSFQKRFSLSEDESILMRFFCMYMNSSGFCEITEHHIGYHGNKGKMWIESLSSIMNLTEKANNGVLLETNTNEYHLHHIANCHMIIELLRVLSCHVKKSTLPSCKITQSKQWKQIHKQQIILERQVSLLMDRFYEYLLSYQFYRLYLLSCNKYGIRIGRWQEEEDRKCCKSFQRDIHYRYSYKIWKKQIECTIHQHQQLSFHRPSNCILLFIQSAISNIPILDTLHLETGWIIKEIEPGKVVVQISYSVNSRSSLVSTTICPILQRELEQEWNQWVRIIEDKEEKREIGTKTTLSQQIIGKENCNNYSPLGWFFLILVAMIYKYYQI